MNKNDIVTVEITDIGVSGKELVCGWLHALYQRRSDR